MKSVTSSKRLRVSLALLTALAMPLGSAFHSADAKPKDSAPAYGYRNKSDSKAQKRQNKRNRRDTKRDTRVSRRNDRNMAHPNDRNERYDDRRNNDSTNRLGVNSQRVRDALNILNRR